MWNPTGDVDKVASIDQSSLRVWSLKQLKSAEVYYSVTSFIFLKNVLFPTGGQHDCYSSHRQERHTTGDGSVLEPTFCPANWHCQRLLIARLGLAHHQVFLFSLWGGWSQKSTFPFPSPRQSFTIDNAHTLQVRDLDFNPNRPNILVSGGDDCAVRFWDVRNTKEALKEIKHHTHWYEHTGDFKLFLFTFKIIYI